MTLERRLQTIGKSTFIKYYYSYKNKSRDYCIAHYEENFTDKAKQSRTSHAQAIFRENLEKEALQNIIQSTRVDELTLEKAQQILKNDFEEV